MMVPMSDMLNHKTIDFNSKGDYDSITKDHVIIAIRDIKRGEEITHNYGGSFIEKRSMFYFFINYGFIEKDSPMVLVFEIYLTEQDPLYEFKIKLTNGIILIPQ